MLTLYNKYSVKYEDKFIMIGNINKSNITEYIESLCYSQKYKCSLLIILKESLYTAQMLKKLTNICIS